MDLPLAFKFHTPDKNCTLRSNFGESIFERESGDLTDMIEET